MKWSVRTKLFVGIGVSVILVAVVGLSSYLSLKGVQKDYDWVTHTEHIIKKNNELMAVLADAESNQRGYILRGNRAFLDNYTISVGELESLIDDLKLLVKDTRGNEEQVFRLEKAIRLKIKAMSDLIAIKEKSYLGASNDLEQAEVSRKYMMDIKSISYEIDLSLTDLLQKRKDASKKSVSLAISVIIFGTLIIFLIVFVLFKNVMKAFKAQLNARREIKQINQSLEELNKKNEDKNWLLTGISKLNGQLQGELSVKSMAENIISSVCKYANGNIGALYLVDANEPDILKLTSGYAITLTKHTRHKIKLSESWVGQLAKEKEHVILEGNAIENLDIQTGLLHTKPLQSIVVPFYFDNRLKGVMEVGFLDPISDQSKIFITSSAQLIGVAVNTAESRETLQDLFEQTQQQAEELESQQEELRVSNEELTSKTELLQASEEELRVQQEELRQINIELEEKARVLENSYQETEKAKNELGVKMKELEQANHYKSEFLANMSHELRTPLNSILILAKILKENKAQRLSEEEQKYASVIHRAGNDLLSLINDILDLSKIESGFIELNNENTPLAVIEDNLFQLFEEVAKNKGVNFIINKIGILPEQINLDKQRLEQILKNLLSNAFKFTPKGGSVEVIIQQENDRINFTVKDTGIGIPLEKQRLIFEAFQQVDGATNREYGGTGLGLSISRELSRLMNATISLQSEPGKGSAFTLSIPLTPSKDIKQAVVQTSHSFIEQIKSEIVEVKSEIEQTSLMEMPKRETPLLFVVEDDIMFNDLLTDYAQKSGFETKQYYQGDSMEKEMMAHLPNAVLLDVMLPGIDGWEVLSNIKKNPLIAQIPVHMMSSGDFPKTKAQKEGAVSFLKKPLEKHHLEELFEQYINKAAISLKQVLLVEDQLEQSEGLKGLFADKNIQVLQAFSGEEALEMLSSRSFDCVILDLKLPDMDGTVLLEEIKSLKPNIPVIINTAMELTQNQLKELLKYSDATVLKSPRSADRLIDEVNLFLHKVKTAEPEKTKQVLKDQNTDNNLENKVVLLVDDDMRNIFSISAILDGYGLKVEIANDGVEALDRLAELNKVDIVLMDIMMPRMDGYETMQNIRKSNKWRNLPIIALTAKAMKDDREKSIAAGANDYIVKPINTDQLISLIKIWIS